MTHCRGLVCKEFLIDLVGKDTHKGSKDNGSCEGDGARIILGLGLSKDSTQILCCFPLQE